MPKKRSAANRKNSTASTEPAGKKIRKNTSEIQISSQRETENSIENLDSIGARLSRRKRNCAPIFKEPSKKTQNKRKITKQKKTTKTTTAKNKSRETQNDTNSHETIEAKIENRDETQQKFEIGTEPIKKSVTSTSIPIESHSPELLETEPCSDLICGISCSKFENLTEIGKISETKLDGIDDFEMVDLKPDKDESFEIIPLQPDQKSTEVIENVDHSFEMIEINSPEKTNELENAKNEDWMDVGDENSAEKLDDTLEMLKPISPKTNDNYQFVQPEPVDYQLAEANFRPNTSDKPILMVPQNSISETININENTNAILDSGCGSNFKNSTESSSRIESIELSTDSNNSNSNSKHDDADDIIQPIVIEQESDEDIEVMSNLSINSSSSEEEMNIQRIENSADPEVLPKSPKTPEEIISLVDYRSSSSEELINSWNDEKMTQNLDIEPKISYDFVQRQQSSNLNDERFESFEMQAPKNPRIESITQKTTTTAFSPKINYQKCESEALSILSCTSKDLRWFPEKLNEIWNGEMDEVRSEESGQISRQVSEIFDELPTSPMFVETSDL